MVKNVVILGANSAGSLIAKQLVKKLPADYRIVLIDANEFAYWPIAALRAAVQPGFEDSVVAKLDNILPKGSQHLLIQGVKVTSLEADAVVLEHSTPDFPDSKVPFERAILSLGSTYAFPCRPASSKLDETLNALRDLQGKVKEAKSFLIVGGGPVGVEFAGEVYSAYPDKKITLVSASKILIPGSKNEKLHSKLLSQLQKAGVRVLLNDRINLEDASTRALQSPTKFTTEAGEEIEADFVLNGFGSKPNTELIKQVDADAVNEAGFIKVNEDLSLKSTYFEKYLAVGDVNDLPGGKTYMAATAQAPAAVSNTVALLTGQAATKKASAPPSVMIVPMGAKGGAAQLPFATFGEWTASLIKGKGLFVSNFKAAYA